MLRIFELTELLTKLGFCATFLVNLLFIFLTLSYTKQITGPYRRMLVIFAAFCIVSATIEIIAQPFTYNFNEGIIFFSLHKPDASSFPYFSQLFLRNSLVLYASCYVTQISFIGIQFVFRYVTLIHHKMQDSFHGKNQVVWLLYLSVIALSYGSTLSLCFPHDKFSDDYMKEAVKEVYLRDITETPRMIQIVHEADGSLQWNSITYSTVALSILGVQYLIITFCTIKMQTEMKNEIANMSHKNQQLERQFFKALTVQILLPTFLLTIPLGLMLSLPLLNLEIKLETGFMFALNSLYPSLDSAATMMIVKEYRWCLRRFFSNLSGGVYKVEPTSSVNHSATNPASTIAN